MNFFFHINRFLCTFIHLFLFINHVNIIIIQNNLSKLIIFIFLRACFFAFFNLFSAGSTVSNFFCSIKSPFLKLIIFLARICLIWSAFCCFLIRNYWCWWFFIKIFGEICEWSIFLFSCRILFYVWHWYISSYISISSFSFLNIFRDVYLSILSNF